MGETITKIIKTINNLGIQGYKKQYKGEKLFKVRYKNENAKCLTKKVSKTLQKSMKKASSLIYKENNYVK